MRLDRENPAMFRVRAWRSFLILCIVGTLALGLVTGWLLFRGSRVHQRAAEPVLQGQLSLYRNTRPDVKYVGDQSCATCHPAHAETYRQHPMSHSFAPVARRTPASTTIRMCRSPFGRRF
jgi:hypothetical protein